MSDRFAQAQKAGFGRRREPHTVIISRHGHSRKFTISPFTLAAVTSFIGIFVVGYLAATAYLVLRDDLITATLARHNRLQHSYEDRIASLRTQIDLITSKQLIEQQAVESRVNELMTRQTALGTRQGAFSDLLRKAKKSGVKGASVPVPRPKPGAKSNDQAILTGSTNMLSAALASPNKSQFKLELDAGRATQYTNDVFNDIESSLLEVEREQLLTIASLRQDAVAKTQKIAGVLKDFGVQMPKSVKAGMGGPLIALKGSKFTEHIRSLDSSLQSLDKVRGMLSGIPIANPVPGQEITSNFGSRVDPINGHTAMHSGTDFRAPVGHPVRATAKGKVIFAGVKGGYGNMVKIRHSNGYSTRYAHLSRILVAVGDTVNISTAIGKAGSTGRSTGPHLHYEVRLDGQAIDPRRFLRATGKLKGLL